MCRAAATSAYRSKKPVFPREEEYARIPYAARRGPMSRSHYVGLVPVTDANYVQRRLRWDKPASGSEQRERERAEMDDAQREP